MLPKYRRVVEQLAQAGLLTVICGTDTLGVGINVPIRTVLFTGLAKYDGIRSRVLRVREFRQIAGRAGRAGYDSAGFVVVQAPEHVIENEKAKKKAAASTNKRSKAQLRKPPPGTVVWTEQTFDKLVSGEPEPLRSRMKVDNSMLINVLFREEDAFPVLRRLLTDNHEERRQQLKLVRRALRLARSLVTSGTLTRLDEPDEFGRRYVMTVDLPPDFALNQPLAHFALAAFDVLDPEAPTYTLDVVSVVEAVLEGPRQILFAQRHAARGEAIGEMKADGIEYEERMALLEEITWPRPLGDWLEPLFEIYRETHGWLSPDALVPKSVLREMWEQAMGFTDFVGRYQLARSEGLVLRYLTDAYRTIRQTVPEAHRTPELDDIVEWLGETIRQTDSSLLDEWEALSDPAHVPSGTLWNQVGHHEPPPPPRPRRPRRAGAARARRRRPARPAARGRDGAVGVGRGAGGLLRRARHDRHRRGRPRTVVPPRGGGGARRAGRSSRGHHRADPPGGADAGGPGGSPRLDHRGGRRLRRLRRRRRAGAGDDLDATALSQPGARWNSSTRLPLGSATSSCEPALPCRTGLRTSAPPATRRSYSASTSDTAIWKRFQPPGRGGSWPSPCPAPPAPGAFSSSRSPSRSSMAKPGPGDMRTMKPSRSR
jgi:hypothetical protein